MRLHLEAGVLDHVTRHLQDCLPNEGCGFLIGREDRAARFVPAPNIRASATAFEVEPGFLLALLREVRGGGERLVAICHSHPSGPPRPSERDIAEAHYPAAFYVIVSFAAQAAEVRAWRIFDGRALEAEIHASC